jgi:hypothetical protein
MFQQLFKKCYTISNQNHDILTKKWVKLIFLCYKYKYLYSYAPRLRLWSLLCCAESYSFASHKSHHL